MARSRRRRSFTRFFRRKTKRNVWSKENFQVRGVFSSSDRYHDPDDPNIAVNPPWTYNVALCSNGATTNGFNIASSLGLRTVKNFTINGSFDPNAIVFSDNGPPLSDKQYANSINISQMFMSVPVQWAIIYVPQGMGQPYLLDATFSSVYEPNQNVIDTGIWQPNAGPLRIHSRMARKLHSGDSIYLCFRLQGSKTTLQYYTNALASNAIHVPSIWVTCSFVTKCN